MQTSKIWPGFLGLTLFFILALALSSHASEIGTYGLTTDEPTGDTDLPSCGSWAGKSYTDIAGVHGNYNSDEDYTRVNIAQQLLSSSGGSNDPTKFGQFCGSGTTGLSSFFTLKKNGSLDNRHAWSSLSTKGNYNDGSFFRPGDPMNKLYWTWQCCLGTNCITCGAKRIAPTCGLGKGGCNNGEMYSSVFENPKGTFVWQCRSYDTYFNPEGLDNPMTDIDERYEHQYISCGINTTSGGGCGLMNGKSIPEKEIMGWNSWTDNPCPDGSAIVNGAIQLDWIDDPNALIIAINPADNPKISQCGGMTWQCLTKDGILSAPCSADCIPDSTPTSSIPTSTTSSTITGFGTNSALATIFNNLLQILANIKAELVALKNF